MGSERYNKVYLAQGRRKDQGRVPRVQRPWEELKGLRGLVYDNKVRGKYQKVK